MAKIKDIQYSFKGNNCKVAIKFSAKNERFEISMPSDLGDACNVSFMHDEDLKKIERRFYEHVAQANAAAQEVTKVIAISMDLDDTFARNKFNLEIRACVAQQSTYANDRSRATYEVLKSDIIPGQFTHYNRNEVSRNELIHYTPEAETEIGEMLLFVAGMRDFFIRKLTANGEELNGGELLEQLEIGDLRGRMIEHAINYRED